MHDRRRRRPGRRPAASSRWRSPRSASRARSATTRTSSFTDDQAAGRARAARRRSMAATFSVSLLDGVTGSGKTEVYFEAVARDAGAGPAGADHAAGDRADQPVHGPLQGALRLPAGRMAFGAVRGRSAGASGARRRPARRASSSARARRCSCPISDLGLIVVDEEHDPGFKQDDRVHYQARDMAVVRGSLGKFPVVLASATPSIESHVNARTGRYRHVVLPGRFSGAELPEVTPIDLRQRSARQGQVAVAGAGRGDDRDAGQGAAVAAVPQPPRLCAADAVPLAAAIASSARSARPGWSSTASATGSTATTAASRCRCRRSARSAASRTALVACGPGVERIAEEVARALSRGARSRCCRPT